MNAATTSPLLTELHQVCQQTQDPRLGEFGLQWHRALDAEFFGHPRLEAFWKLLIVLSVPSVRRYLKSWKEEHGVETLEIPPVNDLPPLADLCPEIQGELPIIASRMNRLLNLVAPKLTPEMKEIVRITCQAKPSDEELASEVGMEQGIIGQRWQEIDAALRQVDSEYKGTILAPFLDNVHRLVTSRMGQQLRRKESPSDVVISAVRNVLECDRHGTLSIQATDDFLGLLAIVALRKMQKKHRFYNRQKRSVQLETYGTEDCAIEELVQAKEGMVDQVEFRDHVQYLLHNVLNAEERDVVEGLLAGHDKEAVAEALDISLRTVNRRLQRAWAKIFADPEQD